MLKHPEIKSVWIFAAGLKNEEELRDNSQLKYHASKIANKINQIITCINQISQMESIKQDLIQLGKAHFDYGVEPRYFKV